MDKKQEAVLQALKEGGSLRYFFLHGGVAVHTPEDTPDSTIQCDFLTLYDLEKEGLISVTEKEVSGYPHYANGHKSSVYKISDKGQALEL